jgi:hypothetical protein
MLFGQILCHPVGDVEGRLTSASKIEKCFVVETGEELNYKTERFFIFSFNS